MDARRILLMLTVLVGLVGCGTTQTARVGEPGEEGVYRKSIETSRQTGTSASDRVHADDKLLNGG